MRYNELHLGVGKGLGNSNARMEHTEGCIYYGCFKKLRSVLPASVEYGSIKKQSRIPGCHVGNFKGQKISTDAGLAT
jgi:hypothetical protein